MKRSAARSQETSFCDALAEMVQEAAGFVPHGRGEAIIRKWTAGVAIERLSDHRKLCVMADSILLAHDLLLSQPAASGSTAFDRLAKARRHSGIAVAAVCAAEFRMLRLAPGAFADEALAHDAITGEAGRLLGADLPHLPDAIVVFGRMAVREAGVWCRAGMLTPLDERSREMAAACWAQGARGPRWAEAVYCHVVRCGTLEVPGLNRPRTGYEDFDEGSDADLAELLMSWMTLNGEPADTVLLQITRRMADLPRLVDGFGSMMIARHTGEARVAEAAERVVLVMMETVRRREQANCGGLALETVRQEVDRRIAAGLLPAAARGVFAELQLRVSGAAPAPGMDSAELSRLMQRIGGLRAKTIAHGCTEPEALAAAEKVAELLDRYGLALGETDFRAQTCEGIAVQTTRRRASPIDTCVPSIAAFFDCRVWMEKAKGEPLRYIFFGLRADVAAAQYLFELVERAFETETAAFRAGKIYAAMAGERRTATNSFQIGMARGIRGKLCALRDARDSHRIMATGRDLVVRKAALVDEDMARLGLDLQENGGSRGRYVLAEALQAGEAAGERFEWAQGIGVAA